MPPTATSIRLRPARIAVGLTAILVLLTLANLAALALHHLMGYEGVFGYLYQFDFNTEGNMPTLFSGALLVLAAVLLSVVARVTRRSGAPFVPHWTALAAIFLYLAADEVLRVHEAVSFATARVLGVEGIGQYYVWVLPFTLLLVFFAWAYLRFFLHLPPRYKVLFALAGLLYVGGALGVELIGAWHASAYGIDTFAHALVYTVEEVMEMGGLIVFIYALLSYLAERTSGVHVCLVNA